MATVRLSEEIKLYNQLAWRNDPKIMQFTRQSDYISPEECSAWIHGLIGDTKRRFYGIYTDVDEDQVGTCGFSSIDNYAGTAEFSMLIGPEHQKKGYGRLAMYELLKHGFLNLGLNKIWGEVMEHNHRAMDLDMKIGFVKEGYLKDQYYKNGKLIGAWRIAMWREAFDTLAWAQS